MRSPARRRADARSLVAVLVVFAASGCETSGTEWPAQVRVEPAAYRHDVTFFPGASGLSDATGQQLIAFLARLDVTRNDRISIAAPASSGVLARQRSDAVATALAARGLRSTVVAGDGLDPEAAGDTVVVMVTRDVVVLPACPDWTQRPNTTFGNGPMHALGCSTAVNFGMMVANPADIVSGRQTGPADGAALARSIDLYREDKTKPLLGDSATADVIAVSGQ